VHLIITDKNSNFERLKLSISLSTPPKPTTRARCRACRKPPTRGARGREEEEVEKKRILNSLIINRQPGFDELELLTIC
jgi:hypothetical protein